MLACLSLVDTTRNAIIKHKQNKIEPTELIPHALISFVLQVDPLATISTFDHRHKSTSTHTHFPSLHTYNRGHATNGYEQMPKNQTT